MQGMSGKGRLGKEDWERKVFMIEQKKIQKMSRREYCSYVQQHYSNDPQWVRTRLISKWDEDNNKRKNAQQTNGQ